MLIYLAITVLLCLAVSLARSRAAVKYIGMSFYVLQLAFAALLIARGAGALSARFFLFDSVGVLFFTLMSVVSAVAFYQSNYYLDTENLHQYKVYNISLMALCASAAGVYFANHIAVTWVFLEATTLSASGLVYHRRSDRSLEATWKYIFVCSVAITIAYLGILLLSTAAAGGDMSYAALAGSVAGANPLYMKMAFLFILVGYSCKMETFPFYTIGVDANFAAPTPASAVISTVLVNAGMVSFLKLYPVIQASAVSGWMSTVMIITGVVSVLIGAVYMRRTNHYKRFFAYSTVENMGIVLIGMGVGGAGVLAAVLHTIGHTFVKSGLFFNVAQIGKTYGTYRINRIGNYMAVNRLGAVSVLLGSLSLMAFPPSALFVSELLILREIAAAGNWILLGGMALLMCFVMYSLCYRVLQLLYKSADVAREKEHKVSWFVTCTSFVLIVLSAVMGILQPDLLVRVVDSIVYFI